MTYSYHQGVIRNRISKLALLTIALLFSLTMAIGVLSSTMAATTTFEFTQDELDNNWEGDRRFPTGDATSVSNFDRDNVARIGIDSDQTAPGGFQRTEGIKTTPVQNFGHTVEVDLYLDPEWSDNAVRAGLWVAGDIEGARSNFGIIEFVNSEDCDAPECTTDPSNITEHTGFRVWESNAGWTNVEVDWDYGNWVTLNITLDIDTNQFVYTLDGQSIIPSVNAGGSTHIREVFLNSYNYGEDTFPNLNSASYAAHWHGGLATNDPVDKNECKKGGFSEFGFRNQGQCIQFVNTGKDSR